MLTYIAVLLSREVIGVSAYQRWNGIKHIESDTSFISNEWVKLALLVLLVGSAISLVAVHILGKSTSEKLQRRNLLTAWLEEG